MKRLATLILSAAIVPSFALSMPVVANDHNDRQAGDEPRISEERLGDHLTREQPIEVEEGGMVGRPAGAFYTDDIIGKSVRHRRSDEEIGQIEDMVIGEDGRIIGIVVKTGSFLGLGGQDVGLSWEHIEHTTEDDESVFYTDVDEETLRDSPEYEWD